MSHWWRHDAEDRRDETNNNITTMDQQYRRRPRHRRIIRRSSAASVLRTVAVVVVAVVATTTTTHHLGLWTIIQSEAFSTIEQSRPNRHSRIFGAADTTEVLGSRNDLRDFSDDDNEQFAETDDSDRMSSSSRRRDFFTKSIATILGCFTATATTAVSSLSQQHIANAACLPGDLSKDCIGVYKLPYLDATQSSWLYDKDTLREFAPDIRYIEVEKQPKTLKEAVGQLVMERKKVKLIKDVVLEGDLEQAGTIILNLIPKVTSAGLKIQQDLYANDDGDPDAPNAASGPAAAAAAAVVATNAMNEIKRRKFENSLQIVIAEWSSIDIAIGQAIRGQRGVTAVAQIEILSYLKDATVALDDFITLINEERETA